MLLAILLNILELISNHEIVSSTENTPKSVIIKINGNWNVQIEWFR